MVLEDENVMKHIMLALLWLCKHSVNIAFHSQVGHCNDYCKVFQILKNKLKTKRISENPWTLTSFPQIILPLKSSILLSSRQITAGSIERCGFLGLSWVE
jgi:hypothetical protein